jgi:hypothetical protein
VSGKFSKELQAIGAVYKSIEKYIEDSNADPLSQGEMQKLVDIFTKADSFAGLLAEYGSREAEDQGELTEVETWAALVVSEINIRNGGEELEGWEEWTWEDDPR